MAAPSSPSPMPSWPARKYRTPNGLRSCSCQDLVKIEARRIVYRLMEVKMERKRLIVCLLKKETHWNGFVPFFLCILSLGCGNTSMKTTIEDSASPSSFGSQE